MIRHCLEELSIISLDTARIQLNVKDILEYFYERRSDVLYVTIDKRLHGVISAGDIKRCKDGVVKINRKFTFLVNWDYIQAKNIFQAKNKINKLPVVDENGYLLGDYSRWDDKRWFIRSRGFSLSGTLDRLNDKEIILVESGKEKMWMFEYEKKVFDRENISYSICSMKDIPAFLEQGDIFVFVDKDELYSIRSVYTELAGSGTELHTFKTLMDHEMVWSEEKSMLCQLINEGIQCYTLSYRAGNDGWHRTYRDALEKRFENVAQNVLLPKECAEAFFEELYSEDYFESICHPPLEMCCVDGVNKIKDVKSKYLNVTDGRRLTVGQPENFVKRIYFFGPCIMIGRFVEDKHTIESFLQEKLNGVGQYQVINCSAYNDKKVDINRILETDFSTGDIVIIYTYDSMYAGIPDINMVEIAKKHQMPVEWTANSLIHCNHRMNKILADEIFLMMEHELRKEVLPKKRSFRASRREYIRENYIKRYFSDFDGTKYQRLGAIVMNCNPFTNGHRYLIERACQIVDFLIIFVVEEDQSLFSFEERFEMVKEGTNDLDKVMVVPSGQFILSETTFPEYFLKIEDEDIIRNTDYDITLFADYIASELHITYRFVGEEPNDNVTNEYNNAMKRILPGKGIHLVEIPRKKEDGMYISASEVRKNVESNERETVYRLVPETTRKVLGWD